MPSQIALILCLAFIFWLLRFERKQHPDMSWALWIPTLWVLLIAGKPLAIYFGVSSSSMEEGSPLDRAFISLLIVVGLIILQARRFDWNHAFREYRWLFVLIGFMLLSIIWSDMPFISLKRWTRSALAPMIMAFVISTEVNKKQAVMSILTRTVYVHIPLSLLLIKYYPHLGVQYGEWSGALMWVGVSSQKNGLACLCLISLFFLIWRLTKRRILKEDRTVRYEPYVEFFLLAMSLWLFSGPNHTLTYSATSTVSLTIGFILFFYLTWRNKRGMKISSNLLTVAAVIIIIYGTLTPFIGGLTIFDPSGLLNRSETLTGRSDIWAYLVPIAMENPILGEGFGGFLNTEIRSAIHTSHAHNGYLEMILNMGFLGLMLWSVFIADLVRKACAEMNTEYLWGVFWYCFIIIGLVHGIAESSIKSFSQILPALMIFLLVSRSNVETRDDHMPVNMAAN